VAATAVPRRPSNDIAPGPIVTRVAAAHPAEAFFEQLQPSTRRQEGVRKAQIGLFGKQRAASTASLEHGGDARQGKRKIARLARAPGAPAPVPRPSAPRPPVPRLDPVWSAI
jgi:hypothetical protein